MGNKSSSTSKSGTEESSSSSSAEEFLFVSPCRAECSSSCSSCYKLTRTGRVYGPRCKDPARCSKCFGQDSRIAGHLLYPSTLATASALLHKTLLRGACLVGLVLLVAVGLAFAINCFGRASLVPQKHGQERTWMVMRRDQVSHTAQPATQRLHSSMYSRLRGLVSGNKGEQSNAEPSNRLSKVFPIFGKHTGVKKGLSNPKQRSFRAIFLAMLPLGLINVLTTILIYLLY